MKYSYRRAPPELSSALCRHLGSRQGISGQMMSISAMEAVTALCGGYSRRFSISRFVMTIQTRRSDSVHHFLSGSRLAFAISSLPAFERRWIPLILACVTSSYGISWPSCNFIPRSTPSFSLAETAKMARNIYFADTLRTMA